MKKGVIIILLFCFAVCSCSKYEPLINPDPMVIYGVLENAAGGSTKTSLNPDKKVKWGKNNEVAIFDGLSTYKFAAESEAVESNLINKSGTNPQDTELFGLYPYTFNRSFSNEKIICESVENQNILSANNFASGSNISFGHLRSGNAMTFYNACALLKFSVTEQTAILSKLFFTPNNESQAFRGKYTLSFDEDDNPQIAFERSENGSRSINITYNKDKVFVKGDYYVVVPPTKISGGYSIRLDYNDGLSRKVSSNKDFQFERNKIYPIGTVPSSGNYFSFEGGMPPVELINPASTNTKEIGSRVEDPKDKNNHVLEIDCTQWATSTSGLFMIYIPAGVPNNVNAIRMKAYASTGDVYCPHLSSTAFNAKPYSVDDKVIEGNVYYGDQFTKGQWHTLLFKLKDGNEMPKYVDVRPLVNNQNNTTTGGSRKVYFDDIEFVHVD